MDECVVGMIAYNEKEINQLYIHNDYQGLGIGRVLLDKAKNQSIKVNKTRSDFMKRMDSKS